VLVTNREPIKVRVDVVACHPRILEPRLKSIAIKHRLYQTPVELLGESIMRCLQILSGFVVRGLWYSPAMPKNPREDISSPPLSRSPARS
jgi:hypothetical protein